MFEQIILTPSEVSGNYTNTPSQKLQSVIKITVNDMDKDKNCRRIKNVLEVPYKVNCSHREQGSPRCKKFETHIT